MINSELSLYFIEKDMSFVIDVKRNAQNDEY